MVGTLHGERSDGKKGGPWIHRGRMKRGMMLGLDDLDEMRQCRSNQDRGVNVDQPGERCCV